MDLVVVADLESPHEAQLARGLLRAHGIPAHTNLDGEALPSTVTGRVSGTAVVVPAEFSAEARALLPDPTPGPAPGGIPGPAPGGSPGRAAGPAPGPAPRGAPEPKLAPPLAASRASRPRWAIVAVLLLVALVVWLLLEAGGLLSASITMFVM